MTREEIKSARTLRKLSQAALARLTHLTASEISRIECGYRTLSEAEEAAIASALGIVPKGDAKAPVVLKEPKPAEAATPQVKPVKNEPRAPAPEPVPVGTALPGKPGSDLSDPVNFGILPDLALLTPGELEETAFRARLAAEIARANTILHTPRVPAAVWRAWRQFEQQGTERLRNGAAAAPAPTAAAAPNAIKAPVFTERSAPVASVALPTATDKSDTAESKNFNSLFVEAARAILPPERVERFNRAAEAARQQDQTIGFMKHFRRIAESELEPALIKQVTEDANQRQASPERWRTRRGRGNSSAAAK